MSKSQLEELKKIIDSEIQKRNDMLIYLLKMIACSAAFYGLYALLFRNEKMLVFNRFYLLGSLLFLF
ncbi:hypothetical protein [Niabella hibiscisoli]|uniref:hypothetical protein n=1 Tax=Niabella hibiscisoli TaxID=1825928 RepID=UPI001F0ECAEC|nr:hypothetical protein [Niabella hibiscisoli]MCH5721301.1 hypothetical protein [Niabella hibiscisoli]